LTPTGNLVVFIKRRITVPSKSPAQHKFFEAIAHSPEFAKKAGVPQSVGKDFAKADDKAGITKTHNGKPRKNYKNFYNKD